MKVTVEVEDFYLDGENDLETGLKEYVKRDVLQQIQNSIKAKVEEHITRKVKDEVEKNLVSMMNQKITELVATENIVISGKEITIAEHIKNQFISNSGWSSPTETIKKLAKTFGDEMKARYDLAFASHVVAKLSENGLLKDDVAKLLIENKKS